MGINEIIGLLSLLAAVTGLTEWRIRTVETRILEKIKDREDVTKVKIDELNSNIQRVEAKLDLLLKLQLKVGDSRHDEIN